MQHTTRLRCSCARICWSPPAWPTPLKSNQDSKLASELNTSGSRKLSRLQSSLRLFCSGVPAHRAQPLSPFLHEQFQVGLAASQSCIRGFLGQEQLQNSI